MHQFDCNYGKNKLSSDINMDVVEEKVPIFEIGVPIVYTVDDDGVLFHIPECAHLAQDSDMLYLPTQQRNNLQSDKQIIQIEDSDGEYLSI